MEQLNQGRYSTLEVRERAVEAISRGLPKGKVAEAYGIDRATLYRWVSRSKTIGLLRKVGSGRPRLLREKSTWHRTHAVIRSKFPRDLVQLPFFPLLDIELIGSGISRQARSRAKVSFQMPLKEIVRKSRIT